MDDDKTLIMVSKKDFAIMCGTYVIAKEMITSYIKKDDKVELLKSFEGISKMLKQLALDKNFVEYSNLLSETLHSKGWCQDPDCPHKHDADIKSNKTTAIDC